jgi:uncharacterized protein
MLPWTVKRIHSVDQIAAEAWNACADPENPFLRHEFFQVLEESGTACPETGWEPSHLLVLAENGETLGVAPLFLKTHSEGEFVFDYSWAAAYQRVGGAYYPKLQSCVPYTPVPGARWLVGRHLERSVSRNVVDWLRQAELKLAESLRVSSLHVTFCSAAEYADAQAQNLWLPRLGVQFHFENPGYADFQDFLSTLSARKRKAVLKERREALSSGVEIEIRSGADLSEEHMETLYRCYRDTCSRKWGRAALTRQFFYGLRERMADSVVLMLARKNGRHIAAALNLQGRGVLYGRNWGCLEDVPYLHFELCYYQAIQYAIDHKLRRVEAGAQGFHKVARGYLPRLTYSLHWIAEPAFRQLLSQVLSEERAEIEAQREAIELEHSPYKQGPGRAV